MPIKERFIQAQAVAVSDGPRLLRRSVTDLPEGRSHRR